MGYDQIIDSWQSTELNNLQLASNADTRITNARIKNQNKVLKSAAEFSTTLADKITNDEKLKREKDDLEAKVDAQETELEKLEDNGEPLVTKEEQLEYNANKAYLKETQHGMNEAALNVLANGGTQEEAEAVASMGGDKLYTYTKIKASNAGKNYKDWLEGEMQNNDEIEITLDGKRFKVKDAYTVKEKQAAMRALRKKFMLENGLVGVNRSLLAEEGGFYENAILAHRSLLGDYRENIAVEKGFQTIEEAKKVFRQDKSFRGLYSSLITAFNPDTKKPFLRKGALDKTVEIIKGQMTSGEFVQEDLDRMGNEEIPDPNDPNKTVKLKDHYPTRFAQLQQHLSDAAANVETAKKATAKTGFTKQMQDYIGTLDGTESSADMRDKYEEIQQAYLKQGYHFESDAMKEIIKNHAEGPEYERRYGEAEDLKRQGLLTSEKLNNSGFPIGVIKAFKDDAKLIDAATSQANQSHINYLTGDKGIVSYTANQSGIDKDDPSVGLMDDYVLAMYRMELGKAIAGKAEDPSRQAMLNTKAWFDNWVEQPGNFDEKGYKVPGFPTAADTSKTETAVAKEIKRQNDVIKKYNKNIFKPENIHKLISQEDLIKSATDYAEQGPLGFHYPPEIETLYNIFGRKPTRTKKGNSRHDIYKQVVESTLGIDLGDKPPSIEKMDTNITKEEQIQLDASIGSDVSARIWGNIGMRSGTPNLEIVPWGEGENAFNWSTENLISFGDTAATMELLEAFPSIATNFEIDIEAAKEGGVDWDKMGLAVSSLAWKARKRVGERVEDWGEHWQTVGKNLWEFSRLEDFGEYLAPSPENSANPNVRSGELQPQMPSNNPNLTATTTDDGVNVLDSGINPETDVGYLAGQQVTELINMFVDSLLGDVDETALDNYNKAKYKYEPNSENLLLLERTRY